MASGCTGTDRPRQWDRGAVRTVLASNAVAFLFATTCTAAAAAEVPLIVEEPIGVGRVGAPVTSGIPLPPGEYGPEQVFSLHDGDAEVPLQTTPLVVDREGFLRWVLLDFQLDLGPGAAKRLSLRPERGAASAAQPIEVVDSPEALVVDTGPLAVTVSKDRPFALFDSVQLRGRPVLAGAGSLAYVEAKTDAAYTAGVPESVRCEYRGPLRVTIRVEGRYEGPGDCQLGYITRITAWAGRTDVYVQHILANSNRERVYHANLSSAAVTLKPAVGPGADVLVGAGEVLSTPLAGQSVWLHQGKVNRYYSSPIEDAGRAGIGDETEWTGSDPQGWLAVRHGDAALLVCDRDFAGDPPRRLSLSPQGDLRAEYVSAKYSQGRGVPFESDHYWLYDLSHKTAEFLLDFATPPDPQACADRAKAARSRLLAVAPPEWYSECDVHTSGRFGTLDDEKACYDGWGWRFEDGQVPDMPHAPGLFVRWEDNHYESEADSPEGLLLMFMRTGQRGYFDLGEAWARYHANLHAWRSDGWVFDDGAIWFPGGGPLGTRRERGPANVEHRAWGQGPPDDRELWRQVQAKACYCHFYGAGLVDYYCLTGEQDALEAALDLVEQKNSEFRKHHQFSPGRSGVGSIRGFGRGFYVITHVLEAVPDNQFVADLARLCRDTLWRTPMLDERGFVASHLGTGFGGFDPEKNLPAAMKAFMDEQGITMDEQGWLTGRQGERWPIKCLGGTWQHAYIQQAANRYGHLFDDEDMQDFTYAFGRFTAENMISQKCHQTHYYTYMDVPIKGQPWDPWRFEPEHTATQDGEGCVHSGYYTRFFPDAITMAYALAGGEGLLDRAREFWHYGSKREYQTQHLTCGWEAVGKFADHHPPKDDEVLSVSRTFYRWAHPRGDTAPPAPITDLAVSDVGDGTATIRFTAPTDDGGGQVARYQVKCAPLPIVSYDDFDYARDDGAKRNFWRAVNVKDEPRPSAPGARENFVVSGVPADAPKLHFVVVSYDDSGNRSALSNLVAVP